MTEFRFIHSSDLHLGRRFGTLPEDIRSRLVDAVSDDARTLPCCRTVYRVRARRSVWHPGIVLEGMKLAAAALTTDGSESLTTDTSEIVVPSQDQGGVAIGQS